MSPLPHICRPCVSTQDLGRLLWKPDSTPYATACPLPMVPSWVGVECQSSLVPQKGDVYIGCWSERKGDPNREEMS